MATTSYGSPYVSGSDLVAAWPAASLTVANAIDAAGYYIGRGINAQTASYTGVLTDAGKTVTMTVATSNTFTVPLNATVAYPTGTRINILNLGAGACTVTATGGVTISGTIAALAQNGAAAIVKTGTNTWSYLANGAGKVLQVVSTFKGDVFTTSSSSYVDVTGLSVTITPSSTANSVLVVVSLALGNVTAGFISRGQMVRDTTPVGGGTVVGSRSSAAFQYQYNTSNTGIPTQSMTFLDSPASVAATTYKVQAATEASGTATVGQGFTSDANTSQVSRIGSSITVYEVAA